MAHGFPNKFKAFSEVTWATSSGRRTYTSETFCKVLIKYALSLRRPLYGTGAKYGASVSKRIRSKGIEDNT